MLPCDQLSSWGEQVLYNEWPDRSQQNAELLLITTETFTKSFLNVKELNFKNLLIVLKKKNPNKMDVSIHSHAHQVVVLWKRCWTTD